MPQTGVFDRREGGRAAVQNRPSQARRFTARNRVRGRLSIVNDRNVTSEHVGKEFQEPKGR